GSHDEAAEHQGKKHQPHGRRFGVEPVRHPRRVDPDPPDGEQQQERLQGSAERQMMQQEMRKLRDREYEHEVEEQLDEGDARVAAPAPGAEQILPPRCRRPVGMVHAYSLPRARINAAIVGTANTTSWIGSSSATVYPALVTPI